MLMVIDTSAIVAIALNEPERQRSKCRLPMTLSG
jgi:uncharacterized protein with PIN domain